jgi:RimJ/RimL family protein N-acetyltransferase
MKPVVLETPRLRLDQPTIADRERIVEYCRDPLFESMLTTPWPYELEHAHYFIATHVPVGWAEQREYTWAIREGTGSPIAGIISFRTATHDIGFWLGAPHRGDGWMTEAAAAVVDWLFASGIRRIEWEAVPGNRQSAAVARKLGFSFTGTGPSLHPGRDGLPTTTWHATLGPADPRTPRPDWSPLPAK